MRRLIIVCMTFLSSLPLFAKHISGGELVYEYIGPGSTAGTDNYKITMRLFRECNSSGQPLNSEVVHIGIYNQNDFSLADTLILNRNWSTPDPPIINNTPGAIPCLLVSTSICYQIGEFSANIDLPRTASGYILTWARYSRQEVTNIDDEPYDTKAAGATFTTLIPGTDKLPLGHNSSPQFAKNDTVIICTNKNFILDFVATDVDNDSLVYSFTPAYNGGGIDTYIPAPSTIPFLNLIDLQYVSPFSGTSPLGADVTINPKTGRISGKAPATAGKYVVNVTVAEYRNGIKINEHRKDFILTIGDCDIISADLPEKFVECSSFNAFFENGSSSSGILAYHWDFGVTGTLSDTSDSPTPAYTYADTGTYKVTLTVTGAKGCVGTDSTLVDVYPNFKTNFGVKGGCFQSPYQFTDSSSTQYGTVNSWYWNFGDSTTLADTSLLKNPSYKYTSADTVIVSLISTSSKGCIDTATKIIDVRNKPTIQLPFTDTLICSVDSVQLSATTDISTLFNWTPVSNIRNANTATPIVFPKTTTVYFVTVDDNHGCTNMDSLTVRVTDRVTVNVGPDTVICQTDSIRINTVSNALYYTWSPAYGLSDSTIENPMAAPDTTTLYKLIASISKKCLATDDINIKVVPYPKADAGSDTSICFGKTIVLKGTISGAEYTWSPTNTLLNAGSLTPTAGPQETTTYTLTVTDVLGCPKPSIDTVNVRVIPPVQAFAGNDTIIVANQPLQLNATGGSIYTWSPATGMNNPDIADPIVTLGPSYDSITYLVKVVTGEGCSATDDIKVLIFKTLPEIFVPSAFTPNGDGKNDIVKPILVGMRYLQYFQVFNRWGQQIFSTSTEGKGWDGTISGNPQASGTYVYVAQAVDYLGKTQIRKGTIVLIR